MKPDLATELDDRKFCRDNVADYFRRHPLETISQETLRAHGAGDAVTQRVSECKHKLKMVIESIPTFQVDASGKKHRLKSRYRYRPEPRLGRDSTKPRGSGSRLLFPDLYVPKPGETL